MDKELHILNVVTVIKWYTGTLCCTFKYLYIFVELKYTGLVFFWCVCLFLYVLIFYTVKPQTLHYKPYIFRPFIYTYNFRNRWKSFSWCEVSDGEVAVWECGPGRSARVCLAFPQLAFKAPFSRHPLENLVMEEHPAWPCVRARCTCQGLHLTLEPLGFALLC